MWNKLSMKEKAALIKVAVSNGLTDLDLIKNKYNEYANGGSTKSSDKEDILTINNIRKNIGKRIVDRVHADGFANGTNDPFDALTQLIFNKKNDPIKRIEEVQEIKNKIDRGETLSEVEVNIADKLVNKLDMMKQHQDALRLYFGQPQVYNTMEKSPYQNIVTKDGSRETYQINDVLSDEGFEDAFNNYTIWKKRGNEFVEDLGKTAQLYDQFYFNNAGLSEGYDKNKGHYISIFDNWDYNTKVANKSGDNIGKYVGGKPFDLYHRFYLDEWNDIPEEYRGAMWLPEVVVTPNNTKAEEVSRNRALGGPLLNQNNPIESFNGGKRLPIVRYDKGGTLNENTNIHITEDGNKVIYDFSQNEDINNPGYLGNEAYDLGVLPNIEVKASTNSASSNRAYRNWLQKQEQQEFNNYIREGTDKFAKPFQYGFLGAMTLPVASGVLGGMSAADAYLASKIPYYTIAKSVLEGVGTAYDVGTRVNDIVTEGKYQPYSDFKEGNYGNAALGLGFDVLNILGTADLYNNVKRTINAPKTITAYHRTEEPFDIDNFYTGTFLDYGLHAGDAENKGDVVYELTIPKPKAKVMDTWENNYKHLSTDYIIEGKELFSNNFRKENPENKMAYFLEYFRNPKNWGKRFPKFEEGTELNPQFKMHFFDDFHFNLRRLLTKKLPYKDRKAFNLEADKLLEEAQEVETRYNKEFPWGIMSKNFTPEQSILLAQRKEINEKVADLLYRYGFDVLEYNNINASEGLKPSYIITNPKTILNSKRIKSKGGYLSEL